eukprot:m.74860 g.74860  ORF g.74860 m.74860 type:complete len:66 (-) comp13953_c1_seq1:203-400(-)
MAPSTGQTNSAPWKQMQVMLLQKTPMEISLPSDQQMESSQDPAVLGLQMHLQSASHPPYKNSATT